MNTYDNPTVVALQKVISKAQDDIWEIQVSDRIESNTKNIGKFFRYQNFVKGKYALFMTVTGLNDNGDMESWSFERDEDECISIDAYDRSDISCFRQITRAEFSKAYRVLLKDLNGRLPK